MEGCVGADMDRVSGYKNATPSLAEFSVSNTISLIADKQCYNGQVLMDVDSKDLVSTSGYNEAQSEVQSDVSCGATCRAHVKSANTKTRCRSSKREGRSFM